MPDFISEIIREAQTIRDSLLRDPVVGPYMSQDSRIPKPWLGDGPIKLIIIGQDPTTRNRTVNEQMVSVLTIGQRSPLNNYVRRICRLLRLDDLNNLYATNLNKSFFSEMPYRLLTQNVDFVNRISSEWLPLLQREVNQFPKATIITLGQPVCTLLSTTPNLLLRDRWGYNRPRIPRGAFSSVGAGESRIQREFFPLPHVQNANGQFYRSRFTDYCDYIRSNMI